MENDECNIQCPFCRETEFDLIGLKGHFEKGYCEVYEKTEVWQMPIPQKRPTVKD